jgi:hypothetical protein
MRKHRSVMQLMQNPPPSEGEMINLVIARSRQKQLIFADDNRRPGPCSSPSLNFRYRLPRYFNKKLFWCQY